MLIQVRAEEDCGAGRLLLDPDDALRGRLAARTRRHDAAPRKPLPRPGQGAGPA